MVVFIILGISIGFVAPKYLQLRKNSTTYFALM